MRALPTNAEIAALYRETAALLDLTGSPPEVVRRRARTAALIEALAQPAHLLLAEGRLGDTKGIGGRTVAEVRTIVRQGRLEPLEGLRRLVPPTLLRLLALPGIDVKRLRILWLALGVVSVADLDLACRRNRLRDLPDLGPALQAKIQGALRRGEGWGPRRFLDAARATAGRLLTRLQREPAALRLAVAGDVRRMEPLVGGIHLLATAHDAEALLDAFAAMPLVREVLAREPRHVRATTETGFEVVLEVARSEEAFWIRLLGATGPQAHVEALARRAASRGLTLGADALVGPDGPVPLEDEAAVYEALELAWVPPERRHAGDLDEASGPIVAMSDVAGVGWLHTEAGAGRDGVEVMLEQAHREGYAWALVADRSRSAFPRGATEEAFRRQGDALAEAAPPGLDAFHGLVADILPDGRLDGSEAERRAADVVIGQVNDGFGADGNPQDERGMTRRLLGALDDPRLDVLDLPPGGCLGGAPAWPADLDAVLRACAARGVALAWSGLPHRHLLPPALHGLAREHGLLGLPAADAHDADAFDQALLAVACARRHGWPTDSILTTRDAAGFRAFLDRKRAR